VSSRATLSSALALALALLSLAGCSSGTEEAGGGAAAAKLFRQQACGQCHGATGKGSSLGPPLSGLAGRWSVDELAAYLADPRGYDGDNFVRSQGNYPAPMSTYSHLSLEERRSLAGWLLERGW